MNEEKEINCVYGSENTPATLFVYDGWYCVKGSVNVNRTYEELNDGVDIEELSDYDVYTACEPIESLKELVKFIDE